MKEKDLHIKLLSYIDGEVLSSEEKSEIIDWIGKNKRNQAYFELTQRISKKGQFTSQLKKVDTDKNWEKFEKQTRKISKPDPDQRLIWTRMAAAILIFILIGTIIFMSKNKEIEYIEHIIASSQSSEIKLTDGSIIILRKGSEISYPKKSKKSHREVRLKGEAYFNISKDDSAPFYVYMHHTTIKVLGTSFNVNESDDMTIVNVLSGKVVFYDNLDRDMLIKLEAGSGGVYNKAEKTIKLAANISENFLYWKTGILKFTDQELPAVFEDLERCFDIRIVVHDSSILRNRLTSSFQDQQLESILNELTIVFDIDYLLKGDTVYIQKRQK